MSVHNLLFDFGQVLIHFIPEDITAHYCKNPDDCAFLTPILFDRKYWNKLDAGTITPAEIVEDVKSVIPERLHEVSREILENWIDILPDMEGMHPLIRKMKAEYGVRVFLLSNISREFAAHSKRYAVLEEMEGCVFSALCGLTKPDPAIFRYTCNTFGILPEETVFIDDNEKNIASAKSVGLQTYLFDGNAEKLERYLTELLRIKD